MCTHVWRDSRAFVGTGFLLSFLLTMKSVLTHYSVIMLMYTCSVQYWMFCGSIWIIMTLWMTEIVLVKIIIMCRYMYSIIIIYMPFPDCCCVSMATSSSAIINGYTG